MGNENRLDSMYEQLWTSPPNAILDMLDISHSPANPSKLLESVGSPHIPENGEILDFGCGFGLHSIQLAEKFGSKVIGIDICTQNLAVARQNVLDRGLQERIVFERADIENLPYSDNRFSLIWGRAVLMHATDLSKVFLECARVLKVRQGS
jgi:geranyl diphosphate 2-C-methyltransferase